MEDSFGLGQLLMAGLATGNAGAAEVGEVETSAVVFSVDNLPFFNLTKLWLLTMTAW